MGRRRKKDGIVTSVYISKELLKKLEDKRPKKVSISDIIETMLEISLKGESKVLEITSEVSSLRVQIKDLLFEKERLEKENEKLQKQIAKLSTEVEKWRKKWDGQKTLDKWSKKTKEIQALAELVLQNVEEGLTWGEVLKKAGVLQLGDRMDILHKLYKAASTKGWFSTDMLVSDIIPDWVLKKGSVDGFDFFVFRRIESLSNFEKAVARKSLEMVSA